MTWARFDDAFWRHTKVRALLNLPKGPEAIALHGLMVTFCADRLTDGYVDKSNLKEIVQWHHSRLHSAVESLVKVGLLDVVTAGVQWQVHDYLEYNPSKEEVLVRRANDARRQARLRLVSRRDNTRDSRPMSQRESHMPRTPRDINISTRETGFQKDPVDKVTEPVDELPKILGTIPKWA